MSKSLTVILLCCVLSGGYASTSDRQFEVKVDSPPMQVAFSPANGILASSGLKSISLIRLRDGSVLRRLTSQHFPVDMIAFSSDGRLLAGHENVSYYENVQVKKRDYAIKVWDTVTGRIKREIPVAHAAINSLAVSGDGEHIAVGNENGSIEIWSLRTGKISRVLRGHKDQVDALLFGPGGNTLISGSFRSARVWDVQRGKTTHLLTGLTDDVRVLSLDAYAHDVVVVCQDSTIRRWDYRTWKLKKAITQRVSPFTFASLSADGRFLATAVTYEGLEHQARSAIWVRDTRSGRTVWKIVSMGGVGPFAIAPDGSRVAVGVEVENGRGLLQIFQTNPSATKGQSLLRKLGR